MKEGSWTHDFLFGRKSGSKCLQTAMPSAVIWKWSDTYSAGRPDVSITHSSDFGMRTTWLEIKVVPGGRLFKPLQLAELKRVDGWYIIWFTEKKRGLLFKARECPVKLAALLETEALSYAELIEKITRML